MISLKNILTVAGYESKVLWRNWFFRIVALLGLGFTTIFCLAMFSELNPPQWHILANSWIMPSAIIVMISIPQVAAVIFLATGLIKKDKKLDTNEVFFVRPISNLDYVLGKALALFKLFFLLNLVLNCIPLIVNLTNPNATLNLQGFAVFPLLISVPTIVFVTGLSFLLVTLIRNQPIAIVLLIGLAGIELIYYFDKFSNILDFMSFRLSLLPSDMAGFAGIKFILWQRSFYLLAGIAFLFLTGFLLDRLPGNRLANMATGVLGLAMLAAASLIMQQLWGMRQHTISLREQMIAVNDEWTGVPNANILSHSLSIEWLGDEISGTSEMQMTNHTGQPLRQLYFTLNPALEIQEISTEGKAVDHQRNLHVVSFNLGSGLAPGGSIKVSVKYRGTISEAAAHLEVDLERYESAREYIIYSLKKKYAFLQPGYVLLTKDVLWYPDTQIGYSRKSAVSERLSFTSFDLKVKVPDGMTAVSQGEPAQKDGWYHFKPEFPLPQISLVIGDYVKKEITVDSITYALYHYPDNDYFTRYLDQLADTLSFLIRDNVASYEDVQKIRYPFRRLQWVEVPLQFTAYNKIYESHQAYLQPETVLLPEEGGEIRQFDFRRQLRDMNQQAAKENQVLTDKQKQANVFNALIGHVFTKQTGTTWSYDGKDADKADYAIFPNYYTYNSGIVSKEWPLLNRSIATYLRNDKQTQNDYSRNLNGISFTEECNNLMREMAMSEILTRAGFNEIAKTVSLKSQYLFSYLSYTLGENAFKEFLFDWVNTHQHQLTNYEHFREAVAGRFGIDISPVIQKVFSETAQPAFEILSVQKYEVMDADRKRYQVTMEVKNSGDTDGVIEVRFNTGGRPNNNYIAVKAGEQTREEVPAKVSVVRQGETKLFGFVLDEKPNDMTINTMISRNIPSVISMPLGALSKQEGGVLFAGERVVEGENRPRQYEVIVDNEDPGFSTFSPIEPTILKAYLDSRMEKDKKYFGAWSRSYAKWLATTGSDFYGDVVRSAHFTRSGDGRKIATWTPELAEDGFYDLYIFLRGKNQNEYHGHNSDGKQFDYHYIIQNADGTDHIKYNVSNAEPGWNYLGSYYFNKTGGSVSLTDKCELRTVYADAVKWVKQ